MTNLRLRGALLLAALALSACRQASDDGADLSRQAAVAAAQCSELKADVAASRIELEAGDGRGPSPLSETLANVSCKLAADIALDDANARIRAMVR